MRGPSVWKNKASIGKCVRDTFVLPAVEENVAGQLWGCDGSSGIEDESTKRVRS